jgi:rSAM/selenodomain-associated transferase 1
MSKQICAVAVMAKASVAGTVKTRLVPPLTYEEAARLNTCCLIDVAANIRAVAASEPIQAFAAYAPQGQEAFFAAVLPRGFELLPPKEPTIGRSLLHAAKDLFTAGYGSVCLVNADSPTLPTAILVEAVRRLRQPGDRVVLGPAIDGGYYLIGLKYFHARLFEEIDWSTDCVYRQTLERAGEIGLPVAALRKWYDVDDDQTLAMLVRELLHGSLAGRRGYPARETTAFLERLAAKNGGIDRFLDRAAAASISCAGVGEK